MSSTLYYLTIEIGDRQEGHGMALSPPKRNCLPSSHHFPQNGKVCFYGRICEQKEATRTCPVISDAASTILSVEAAHSFSYAQTSDYIVS